MGIVMTEPESERRRRRPAVWVGLPCECFRADNRRNTVHPLSAGDARSDAIGKFPVIIVCGPELELRL